MHLRSSPDLPRHVIGGESHAPRGLTPSGLLAFSPPIPILPPLAYPLGLDSTVTSEQESVTMVGSDGGSTTAVKSSDAGSVTSGGKKPLKERPKVLETIMEKICCPN